MAALGPSSGCTSPMFSAQAPATTILGSSAAVGLRTWTSDAVSRRRLAPPGSTAGLGATG